jgi:glycosyltransferase involved in cell wall biosynthesis
MEKSPEITICIVAWNEEDRILRCLESLGSLSPLCELLLIDNGSTDRTLEKVAAFSATRPELVIRVVHHAENNLGLARRRAVELASGRWIAFIDADCVAPENWIARLRTAWLERKTLDPKTVAVGGGNRAPESLGFYRSLSLMLDSFLGHLKTPQAYCPTETRKVSHLPTCNVLYDRAAILDAGNFSGRFKTVCEDLELNQRLTRSGSTLYQLAHLEVRHYHSPGFNAWARKMFRYGCGQMHVARFYPGHLAGLKALPLVALSAWLALLAFAPRLALAALGGYVAILVFYSCFLVFSRQSRNDGNPGAMIARVCALFAVTHFSYACGELCGALGRSTR